MLKPLNSHEVAINPLTFYPLIKAAQGAFAIGEVEFIEGEGTGTIDESRGVILQGKGGEIIGDACSYGFQIGFLQSP